MSDIPAG